MDKMFDINTPVKIATNRPILLVPALVVAEGLGQAIRFLDPKKVFVSPLTVVKKLTVKSLEPCTE